MVPGNRPAKIGFGHWFGCTLELEHLADLLSVRNGLPVTHTMQWCHNDYHLWLIVMKYQWKLVPWECMWLLPFTIRVVTMTIRAVA